MFLTGILLRVNCVLLLSCSGILKGGKIHSWMAALKCCVLLNFIFFKKRQQTPKYHVYSFFCLQEFLNNMASWLINSKNLVHTPKVRQFLNHIFDSYNEIIFQTGFDTADMCCCQLPAAAQWQCLELMQYFHAITAIPHLPLWQHEWKTDTQ